MPEGRQQLRHAWSQTALSVRINGLADHKAAFTGRDRVAELKRARQRPERLWSQASTFLTEVTDGRYIRARD
jgi:hypothetical protein